MGRKKLFGIVTVLSILLVVPFVFSSGVVNMASLMSSGSSASSSSTLSSPASDFVTPGVIVKDYELYPEYRIGQTFSVDVNVSDVSDLFSWQINMSWNPLILNVNRIFAGEFLLRTDSPSETASFQLGFVINVTDNVEGLTGMSESILGDAVPGESGNGTLVSVEFLVVGYGWTELNLNLVGNLATTLLNSTGGTVTFNVADGWFDNRITGDVNADGVVSVADRGEVSDRWTGPPSGLYPYARYCDLNDDGRIGVTDRGIVSDNWGRIKPP